MSSKIFPTLPPKLANFLFDAQGLIFAIVMLSFGIFFLKSAGLVMGQTAGVAVLVFYLTSWNFGLIMMAISLPFFVLSFMRRGIDFTSRTIFVLTGLSILSPLLSEWITFSALPPLLAAIFAGYCNGIGLIGAFRHKASAGGLGILALIVEERTGIKTGWFQLGFDAVVFVIAYFVLPFESVAYSFIGAVVFNAMIAWNFNIAQTGKKAKDLTR